MITTAVIFVLANFMGIYALVRYADVLEIEHNIQIKHRRELGFNLIRQLHENETAYARRVARATEHHERQMLEIDRILENLRTRTLFDKTFTKITTGRRAN